MTCLVLVGGSFTGNNLEFLLFSFSTLLNENQSNRRQIILMNFWALHVKRLLEKIYLKRLNFAPMLVLLLSCLNIKNCLIQGKYFHFLFSNWWATTKTWNQVFVLWESSGSWFPKLLRQTKIVFIWSNIRQDEHTIPVWAGKCKNYVLIDLLKLDICLCVNIRKIFETSFQLKFH